MALMKTIWTHKNTKVTVRKKRTLTEEADEPTDAGISPIRQGSSNLHASNNRFVSAAALGGLISI